MVNAEVEKNEGENAVNLIRRFQKKVQGSGLLNRMRARRYYSRAQSRSVRHKHALKMLKRREDIQELIKLGKVIEKPKRGGRRR